MTFVLLRLLYKKSPLSTQNINQNAIVVKPDGVGTFASGPIRWMARLRRAAQIVALPEKSLIRNESVTQELQQGQKPLLHPSFSSIRDNCSASPTASSSAASSSSGASSSSAASYSKGSGVFGRSAAVLFFQQPMPWWRQIQQGNHAER